MGVNCKHPTCGELCRRPKKERKRYVIPKVSKKQAKRNRQYSALAKEYKSENPLCQFPGCCRWATDVHHPQGRIGERLLNKDEFKGLCREHHTWAETHPKEAKELGLSKSRL